jgi:pilus assembly protein CpaD
MPSRLPFLLLSLSTLGACATMVTPPPGPVVATRADSHRIEVTQTTARMEINVDPANATLTEKAKSDLAEFATSYLRLGHGALILSTPSGGANADAASSVAGLARMALVNAGVSYGAVAGSTYDASGQSDAPVIVTFARFEAQAPDCAPIYTQDLAHQMDNQPWASFGCSMQANLAAEIEDPNDLQTPRPYDPRDSNRRATVMDLYRRGQVTHAQRDNDERVTVSTAATNN